MTGTIDPIAIYVTNETNTNMITLDSITNQINFTNTSSNFDSIIQIDLSGNLDINSNQNINIDPSNSLIVYGILELIGNFSRGPPVTISTGFWSIQNYENWFICDFNSTITITLPSASYYIGRELMLKNINVGNVISNDSNVVPLIGGSAGTSILPGTAGATATLVSDGTNWIIMQ